VAKPFIKWAGGKTQLLAYISKALPEEIRTSGFTYIEPFVGGGAVLFRMIENIPTIGKIVINDVNTDLINAYKTVRDDVDGLIALLSIFEREYHAICDTPVEKKEYFYAKRALFNQRISDRTVQTALLIFLNRTCFNGLYRVNSKNQFNVPVGSYKKPMICDADNLKSVSGALKDVIILNTNFEQTSEYATKNTLFYFDPPYKPLSKTSGFNSYAKNGFDDREQIRLAKFCTRLDQSGYKWILSNSDVKGTDPENDFFDDLYSGFNIKRVVARRMINSNPDKRGKLTELLITNYDYEEISPSFKK